MCKYCKLKEAGVPGEKSNNVMEIMKLKDGSHTLELKFNRYAIEEEDVHNNELIIDMSVDIRNGSYTVKEKHIDIKYCPFCGEKL